MIRTVQPDDLESLYAICLQTGAGGQDATDQFENSNLLGEVFVGPYVMLAGCIGFTFEDAEGLAGYALGALDTKAFEIECKRSWWPTLRARYADPGSTPRTVEQEVMAHIYHPPVTPPEITDNYPAHLHIDLLPRVQGIGLGRKMIATLLKTMANLEVAGVHLGVDAANANAIGFYEHLGFTSLSIRDDERLMGKQLDVPE